jgi:hypothetical protein
VASFGLMFCDDGSGWRKEPNEEDFTVSMHVLTQFRILFPRVPIIGLSSQTPIQFSNSNSNAFGSANLEPVPVPVLDEAVYVLLFNYPLEQVEQLHSGSNASQQEVDVTEGMLHMQIDTN